MVTDRRKYSVKAGRDLRPFERWCMPRAFVLPARPAGQPPPAGAVPMPQPELIIFDCDGVLVDSEIIAARIEADLLTAAGYRSQAEELSQAYAGLTFKDILLKVEEKSQIPFQASLIDQAEVLVDRRLASEVRAIEGAAARWPRPAPSAASAPTREPSGSIHAGANRVAARSSRAGCSPRSRRRPASPSRRPTCSCSPPRRWAPTRRNTFVIEDSVHGIAGAKAAGMRVIGFTGAAHSYPGHADHADRSRRRDRHPPLVGIRPDARRARRLVGKRLTGAQPSAPGPAALGGGPSSNPAKTWMSAAVGSGTTTLRSLNTH